MKPDILNSENKVWFENSSECVGKFIRFFVIKQTKNAQLLLCSVVKHLGSGRARSRSRGKHPTMVSCFSLHFLNAPVCFTTEQIEHRNNLFRSRAGEGGRGGHEKSGMIVRTFELNPVRKAKLT